MTNARACLSLVCAALCLCACAVKPHAQGPRPGLPACEDAPPTSPSAHRLLAEHLLTLAATLEAATLTTPALIHPLTEGWLATLPPAGQSLPAQVAAVESAWPPDGSPHLPSPPPQHLRCDAPPLALAQYRLTRALTRASLTHPDAAQRAAAALSSWLDQGASKVR